MELAKKVHECIKDIELSKLEDTEMKDQEKNKSDTDEIGDLLSEKTPKPEKMTLS
jgi:hypothetical protein